MITNDELLNLAKKVSNNSYSIYSNFKVGACVLFDSGNIYTGTNVENSSYGLTLCAERSSISNAISNGEKGKILKIAIFSPNKFLCYPCGACCQWICEFSISCGSEIILQKNNTLLSVFNIQDLLPYSFNI